MDKCCVCGEAASKRCSKCKSVSYCSTEHQKNDWKKHKTFCQSPSSTTINDKNGDETHESVHLKDKSLISDSEQIKQLPYSLELMEDGVDHGGLYMFANKDLKPGDVIFQEFPALISPLLRYGAKNESLSPCWGCYKPLWGGKGDVYRCTKCGLSVCSTLCENVANHKQNECRVIRHMKAKLKRRGMTDEAVLKQYMDVSILRFLIYRDQDPKVWEYFRKLETSSRSSVYQSCYYCGADVVGKDGKDLKLSMMYTGNNTELVLLVCNLLSTFWDVASFGGPMLRALYCCLSCVQHDCVGNTFSVCENDTKMLTLKAAVFIKKGELLTYDFLDKPWASTMTRKANLIQKNIICSCNRCSDSTEFGTFCSSFQCSKCETGIYLPIDPDPVLSVLEESVYKVLLWKCNESECGDTISYESIHTYVEAVKRDYQWNKDDTSNCLGTTALNFYNNMCSNRKKLGPTHSLTLEVMDDYLQEDRNSHEFTKYLTIGEVTRYTEIDLVNLRRKREFAHRLLTYVDKVKKDCIHTKKCYLYVEYGYYNLVTAALEYSRRLADRSDVVNALESAIDLWEKARDMLKFLITSHDSLMSDYKKLVDTLYLRFRAVIREEEFMIPFLMAELNIDWSDIEDEGGKEKKE